MNDRISPQLTATPDGEAEISLVVRLPWEDVARLGQEAGRLAAQMQRPVTLDEAVSNRLRSNPWAPTPSRPGLSPPPWSRRARPSRPCPPGRRPSRHGRP
jgi:hypothetical protein